MSERSHILFVGPAPDLTFVQTDLRLLRERFQVSTVWRRDYGSRSEIAAAVRRALATGTFKLLFVWFAEPYDTYSLVLQSRRFNVKSAVVVGGYEVTYLPEIDYGGLKRLRDRVRTRLSLQLATAVLPTSHLLAREVASLGRRRGVEVVPLGIDCDFFEPGEKPKERLVSTVATISKRTERLKGLDVFAKVSRRLPDVAFSILGPIVDPTVTAGLQREAGPNLHIEGRHLSPEELRVFYQRSSVYAQLSARESFGAALAEAMACCCRPVVTRRGALGEVVGDTGKNVEYDDIEAAAREVKRAIELGPSQAARERVIAMFSVGEREARLLKIVEQLIM